MFSDKDGAGELLVKYKDGRGRNKVFAATSGWRCCPAYKSGVYYEFKNAAGESILVRESFVSAESKTAINERELRAEVNKLEAEPVLRWVFDTDFESNYSGFPDNTNAIFTLNGDTRTFLISVREGKSYTAVVHYPNGHEVSASDLTFNKAVRKLFKGPKLEVSYPVWTTDKF